MVRHPQVLANDVVEFMPYVFQIFSQLLELRPAGEFSAVSGVARIDQCSFGLSFVGSVSLEDIVGLRSPGYACATAV